MVIADEVIGQVKRIVKGIEINRETLAVDVISRVGSGGHFIEDEHTFNNFKKEFWFPSIFDRSRYGQWWEKGEMSLGAAARCKLTGILTEHRPEPLEEKVSMSIKDILASL